MGQIILLALALLSRTESVYLCDEGSGEHRWLFVCNGSLGWDSKPWGRHHAATNSNGHGRHQLTESVL